MNNCSWIDTHADIRVKNEGSLSVSLQQDSQSLEICHSIIHIIVIVTCNSNILPSAFREYALIASIDANAINTFGMDDEQGVTGRSVRDDIVDMARISWGE
mgnify:CR=1 FL=1